MSPTQEERGAVRPVRAGRDRPIIFSAPMVRALLDGRKRQTRRIVKRPMDHFHGSYTHVHQDGERFVWSDGKGGCQRVAKVPGAGGDRLWVREAFARVGDSDDDIHACPDLRVPAYYRADAMCPEQLRWRSPIHMPRALSRLTLIVEAVKVERLQDISEEDARAEGISERLRHEIPGGIRATYWAAPANDFGCSPKSWGSTPTEAYRELWADIHGKAAWDANPFVCALTFRAVAQNVDSLHDTPSTNAPTGDQPHGGGL